MKALLLGVLRRLLAPLHRRYARRNGTLSAAPRKELPNDILLGLAREAIRDGHTATIGVKGYSMRPFLEHLRDKVRLGPPDDLRRLDAVLAETAPGHYVLHRIVNIEGERITLMGDGNTHGEEHCLRKDVAGRVELYIRPRRTIPASDPVLCRRIRLWHTLLPLRRPLLFIYKAIL